LVPKEIKSEEDRFRVRRKLVRDSEGNLSRQIIRKRIT